MTTHQEPSQTPVIIPTQEVKVYRRRTKVAKSVRFSDEPRKIKKHTHKPKVEDSIQEKLYLLHMDLYRPIRIQSINGQKYILVIVDDYSRTRASINDSWNNQFRTHEKLSFSNTLCHTNKEGLGYFVSTNVASPVLAVVALELADPTDTPSSTSIDQDAPSLSAHLDNDPFFGVSIPDPNYEESSLRDVIPTSVYSINQPREHLRKWTKDHPLDNVIGNPSRPVSTRHQ
ncbi:hypothetical protein Tco_0826103 [Tanacetum coccineum]